MPWKKTYVTNCQLNQDHFEGSRERRHCQARDAEKSPTAGWECTTGINQKVKLEGSELQRVMGTSKKQTVRIVQENQHLLKALSVRFSYTCQKT